MCRGGQVSCAAEALLKALMVRVWRVRSPCGHYLSAGRNFACNSLQGISNHELEPLKFCRLWLVGDAGSAGIACEIVEVIPGLAVRAQHGL